MSGGYFLTEGDRDTLVPLVRGHVAVQRPGPDGVKEVARKNALPGTLFVRPKKGTTVPGLTFTSDDLTLPVLGKGTCEAFQLKHDKDAIDPVPKAKLERVAWPPVPGGPPDTPDEVWEFEVFNPTPIEVFYTHFVPCRRSRLGVLYVENPPICNWLAKVPTGGIINKSKYTSIVLPTECEIGYARPDGVLVWLMDNAATPAPIKRPVLHLGPSDIAYDSANATIQTKMLPSGVLVADVVYCEV